MKATEIYLEHANITVSNLSKAIHFFKTAFPSFEIRGGGKDDIREWIHLGNDKTYLAINQQTENKSNTHEKDYGKNGFNHIGFVVSDVSEVANRLLAEGYKRDYPKQIEKFRIRDYFLDDDGNEYEFVQYLTDDISKRNSFE